MAELQQDPQLLRLAGTETSALEYFHAARSTTNVTALTLLLLLQRMYGGTKDELLGRLHSIRSLCSQFINLYGDGPVTLLHAPARIGMLGEHIDYVSYLPTASLTLGSREHDMLMMYRESDAARIRGASCNPGYVSFDFNLDDPFSAPSKDIEVEWLSYLSSYSTPPAHWGNYVKAATEFSRLKYGPRLQRGFDFLIDSSIPAGGGASSSSALVVLAFAALLTSNRIEHTAEESARDCAKAEWYVGTRGGSMDHITICLAQRNHAVLIDFKEDRARLIKLSDARIRWATFFSLPAEKSRAVMIEYNERAAISRIVIPALIEGWKTTAPEQYESWKRASAELGTGSSTAFETAERLLGSLPARLTLIQIADISPTASSELKRSFPALVEQRGNVPLEVRSRAIHHLGEVRRVAEATSLLQVMGQDEEPDVHSDSSMRALGKLLNESNKSLRDLYEVSTTDLNELITVIHSDPNVFGARIMGGGFGGNVLALTTEENVPSLIGKVQNEYYAPRQRDGLDEGSIMISTAGDGLSSLQPGILWRKALEEFNSAGDRSQYQTTITRMLDQIGLSGSGEELWPVIVVAGKGTRAKATGLGVPKPVAPVLGIPSIVHVIRSIRAAAPNTRTPIVIVSPETETQVRTALANEEVIYVQQERALGTGDAVLCTRKVLSGFQGRLLVVWGTQPTIRAETIVRALKIALLFDEYQMVVPTTMKSRPYAPLLRDERGFVRAAHETYLQKIDRPAFGETNIGLFVLKSEPLFGTLTELRRRYWDNSRQSYDRPAGELGFPNELINTLSSQENGIFACAIAESDEEQGIKELDDVGRCEEILLRYGQRAHS